MGIIGRAVKWYFGPLHPKSLAEAAGIVGEAVIDGAKCVGNLGKDVKNGDFGYKYLNTGVSSGQYARGEYELFKSAGKTWGIKAMVLREEDSEGHVHGLPCKKYIVIDKKGRTHTLAMTRGSELPLGKRIRLEVCEYALSDDISYRFARQI